MCTSQVFINIPLLYNINKLVELNSQDDNTNPISIFRTIKSLEIDAKNMITSLLCMSNYIKNRSVITSQVNGINQLEGFEQAT